MQSLSLPGSVRRPEVADLRATSCCAARLASRARAARMMRATIDSATLMFVFSQCSSAGRTCESTADITSGLFRRSLVCPWNCGSGTNTLSTATSPSRMSSAVSVTPFGRQVVGVDEVADRLAQAGAEAVLVRAARSRRNAVDVAAHVLVGGLRPLQREVEPDAALVALAARRLNGASWTGGADRSARIFFR